MKKNNIIKFVVTLMALLFMTGTATAAGRVRVFEMGESGYTIEFPMTTAEIEAEKSRNAIVTATGRKNASKPKGNVEAFEMGESGHRIIFSMTAADITAEIGANARLAAIRATKLVKPRTRMDVFELAESGLILNSQ